jgi:CMP-N,N'-diacetyllegionaminic acid synthase
MKSKLKKIILIIPVRMGSKRLKNKNILPIKKVPMFVYVARKILKSKFEIKLFISSESSKIKELCEKYDINFLKRPKNLSNSIIEKQEAIVHAIKYLIKKKEKIDIVISLQANSPEVKVKDLDNAIDFFVKNNIGEKITNEVISVGKDNLQNGAFRIMKKKTVFQKTLSTKVGIFFTDYIDIHNKKDYQKALKNIG